MNILDEFEKLQMKEGLPEIHIGDKVRVSMKIVEGARQRLQIFEGVVIARHRGNNRSSITVRKQSYSVGVERVFPSACTECGKDRGSRAFQGETGKALLPERTARQSGTAEGDP